MARPNQSQEGGVRMWKNIPGGRGGHSWGELGFRKYDLGVTLGDLFHGQAKSEEKVLGPVWVERVAQGQCILVGPILGIEP